MQGRQNLLSKILTDALHTTDGEKLKAATLASSSSAVPGAVPHKASSSRPHSVSALGRDAVLCREAFVIVWNMNPRRPFDASECIFYGDTSRAILRWLRVIMRTCGRPLLAPRQDTATPRPQLLLASQGASRSLSWRFLPAKSGSLNSRCAKAPTSCCIFKGSEICSQAKAIRGRFLEMCRFDVAFRWLKRRKGERCCKRSLDG